MKNIISITVSLAIGACFLLTGSNQSCAEELYKNISLEYGNLNPPCTDAKDTKTAVDIKAAVDAKVPDAEKTVVPGVLSAKYGFKITNDFLPYVGAGMAYRVQSEVKPGDSTQQINAGVAGQAGFRYLVSNNSSLNFDYKYLNLGPDESRCGTKAPPQSLGVGITIKF